MGIDKERDFERVQQIVEELAPELKKLALDIHANPELGRQEVKACQWQEELLGKYGFEIEHAICGIPTAYKAVYKGNKPGPKMAMLAEYDALPDLGHACGHNLIAMIGVGSGIAMREFVDKYGGEIHVIGTPAEETEGLKVELSARGTFKEYDVAMMAHPAHIHATSMDTSAMIARKFEFFGHPAHAAVSPEDGVNALDGMINFYNLVNALRQQTKDDARIHGVITNGGSAANVIPEYTEALFYVRAHKMSYVQELLKKIEACAEGAAVGTGCTVKVTPVEADYKDTKSNRTLDRLVCKQLETLGLDVVDMSNTVIGGSSDFGDVSYECPGVQMSVGLGESVSGKPYFAHEHEFALQTKSEQGLANSLEFVKAFVMTGIELMTEPEHLKAIKEEFDKAAK